MKHFACVLKALGFLLIAGVFSCHRGDGKTLATDQVEADGAAAFQPGGISNSRDWPMWGGTPERNQVNPRERGIPAEWDIEKGKNIKWVADLGSRAYGNPVVAGGRVFVGTNNDGERNPEITGDKGVLMCFRESDGAFLWQAAHAKLSSGRVNDWPEEGICSTSCVEGDRIYYVSNRCELVCADVEGFLDGENDGPFTGETHRDKTDADFIWILDMMQSLSVFPHNMSTSSPLIVDDLVFILTSNGVDESHEVVPRPEAPSFIAVNKNTGKVVWADSSPGKNILHGQWSSPTYGMAGGHPQVIFPGGDGWLYAFEPRSGKCLWKFDCNPKDSKYEPGGMGDRSHLVATAVIHSGHVYIGVGDDPECGEGVGHLYSINPAAAFSSGSSQKKEAADITRSGQVWHFGGKDFTRTLSTVAIQDGLVYASNLTGFLHCLDQKTGKSLWIYDLFSAVWGSPMVVDGKVFLGSEDGEVIVMQAGREKKLLAKNDMGTAVYGTAVAANGVLYIASRTKLYAIQKDSS